MKVSIIIPTYNRGSFIRDTIESIVDQSYFDWELIIVDDGSLDETRSIVAEYIGKDKRIHYYLRPSLLPKGANSCRNFGLLKSKGDYIKWMDSDDILVKDCLDLQVSILEENSDVVLCLGYSQFFNNSTKEMEELWSRNDHSENYLSDHIVNKIRWGVGGPLWRKSWLKLDPYNNHLKNSQEWLMHGVSLVELEREQIFNCTRIICHVRRGHERMSSSRSANYYVNQVRARLFLMQKLVMYRRFSVNDVFQLIKQSIVYLYYACVSFFRNLN